jgi:hypothetical protein
MRVKSLVLLAAIVCLLPISASADISRISPSTIALGNVEEFLTIFGSGFAGRVTTQVMFDGPAGQFQLYPSNGTDAEPPTFPDGILQVFIPIEVAITPGPYSVTVLAIDENGTRVSGPVIFTVEEPQPEGGPLLNLPETLIVEATSREGTIVEFDLAAISANGQPVDVVCDHASGSSFNFGLTRVSCSASDAFGTAEGSFNVIVADQTRPVLTLPADIVTDSRVVEFTVTAVDNLDGVVPVSCTPASGSTFAPGVTEVVCFAEDSSNNPEFGFFHVTTPGGLPVLTLPADITVDADASGDGAVVAYTVTATEDATVECIPQSGLFFPLGLTTVNCTATNLTGVATGSFKIRVRDTVPPVLSLPGDITAEATSSAGAAVTFAAWGIDAVDGVFAAQCTPASGSTFALGTTAVSCTATDQSGNSASGGFSVTVRDTTPPALHLPSNLTREATGASGAVVTYSATATDLVDGNVTPSCSRASGSTFPLGTTAVTCTAVDAHGNRSNGGFNVTVVDSTPPQILSVTATPYVLWPPNHKMVNITVQVVAVDAVDPAPVSRIISVSSNQPINGTGDGDTSPDWVITGPLTVQLRAERAQGNDRTYTITVKSTDASGNSSTATEQVFVSQSRRRAVH